MIEITRYCVMKEEIELLSENLSDVESVLNFLLIVRS